MDPMIKYCLSSKGLESGIKVIGEFYWIIKNKECHVLKNFEKSHRFGMSTKQSSKRFFKLIDICIASRCKKWTLTGSQSGHNIEHKEHKSSAFRPEGRKHNNFKCLRVSENRRSTNVHFVEQTKKR